MAEERNRREELESLAATIEKCRKCPLWRNTHHAVPGEGNVNARLMLIGEAPGEQEDLTGRPFVGRAGRLLNNLLEGIGLTRQEVFIGNVVKHRPPKNRDPRGCEIEICSPYLDRQIEVICPDLLVTLGRHSSRYILSKVPLEFERITEIRGRVIDAEIYRRPMRIIPSLHPAAGLYSPSYRKNLEEDFQIIKRELKSPRASSGDPEDDQPCRESDPTVPS